MYNFFPIRLITIIGLLAIFVYTLYLIRNHKLSVHLAVSWIMVEVLLIITASVPAITNSVLLFLGENNFYPIAFLFIIGWIALLMLDTLIRVSDVVNKTRVLIQENGLLREKVERLEQIISELPEQTKDAQKNKLGKE
jgi:hypothetical protein